jgi:ABC-type nitrate/sulfonate/bicarbonate transport system substrate-binding protein
MVANLRAGNLDGFCAGEPWNTVAVQMGAGWCVASSAELAPGHPEKVLMVRRDFAEERSAEHLALVAALLEACEFCDQEQNRERLVATLARPEYVNVPTEALRRGIEGPFDFGNGLVRTVPEFNVFHRRNANEPSGERAAWVLQRLRASGLCKEPLNFSLGRRVFRSDLYENACSLRHTDSIPHENDPQTETELAPV